MTLKVIFKIKSPKMYGFQEEGVQHYLMTRYNKIFDKIRFAIIISSYGF